MGYSRRCKFGTITAISGVLTVFGSVFLVYWPGIFESVLNDQLALSSKSQSYELWLETPIPMYIEFYLFNWTNVKDQRGPNRKPNLTELGPYVFREHRRKVGLGKLESDVVWNSDNDTVTFRQNRTWEYVPELSRGSLDDDVVTINIPAITAAFAIRNDNQFIKGMLNRAMNLLGTRLYVKKKVREFLFEGYSDPLLDLASLIPPEFVPVTIPFDKFGWFYTRNGSADYDGIFNMKTGVDDIQKLGVLAEWDYTNHTTFYESHCGMVNGSAGEFFPPERDKSKISLFSPDICRTLDLNFKEEVEVDGIKGYRYWGDDEMFANQTKRPDNWCWCPAGECPPHGALDVSTCKWGAPAYISFPHFYHADPSYREAVIGMVPNETKHQMYIDLEPMSGIPLQVSAAFQINILLQPDPNFSLFRDVTKTYFPAIWFKQTARIDDKIGPKIKLITMIPAIGTISSMVLLSIGVTTLVVVGLYWISKRCRENDDTFHGLVCAGFTTRVRSNGVWRRFSNRIQPENAAVVRKMPEFLRIPVVTGTDNMSQQRRSSLIGIARQLREETEPLFFG